MIRARELRTETGNRWAIHLVLLIEAIAIAIAHPGLWYTVAGTRTGELEIRAGFRCTEFALVGTVATVILRIALPSCGDAAIIGTGELISAAGHIWTAHLVTIITAIVFRVAMECHWHTATGFALKFVCITRWFRTILHLITVVQAVILAIAHPGLWHTSENISNFF